MSDTEDTGRFIGLHAGYETSHPAEAEMEVIYERGRRGRHIQIHGSDDGYKPRREFPCLGTLREYGRNERLIFAVCDACRFETSFDRDDRAQRGVEQEQEATAW